MNSFGSCGPVAETSAVLDPPDCTSARRAVAGAVALAGVLILVACGGGETVVLHDPNEVITCDHNGDGVVTLAEKTTCQDQGRLSAPQ